MTTWHSGYNCTDCGREVEQAGTCNDCLVAHQAAEEKIRKDLAKTSKKGRK